MNKKIVPDQDVRLLTIDEAGDRLSLSRPSVYRLMENGELPFVRIGRSRRIALSAVAALVTRNTVGAGAGAGAS